MLNVTLHNLAFAIGLLLLAGSLMGSVLSYLRRLGSSYAARAEARRFAAGGYERPVGWPEPAWAAGPVPTKAYRAAAPEKPRKRGLKAAAAFVLVFGASAFGLQAVHIGVPVVQPEEAITCHLDAIAPAGTRCMRFSKAAAPSEVYGRSFKLSDTRLSWPAAVMSR